MRLLPRFREERILREQVALVYKNYFVGILGFYMVTIIATIILKMVSEPTGVYYLLLASTAVCFVPLIRYWRMKDKDYEPVVEATKQVRDLLLIGLVWTGYLLLYMDGDNLSVMVTLIAFTTGLTAAALSMQSPCLPTFLAFALTTLPALILGLFSLGTTFYYSVTAAATLYLMTMIYFGYTLELTVKNSIELRFKNLALIDQLQEAISETEEANRAKSVFLASASHDLRQPLHAMSLFIQTLFGTKLDSNQKKIVSHIESASDATREMLNALLDFSKLDAGVIEPVTNAFRLQPLLTKMENELAPSADNKKLIYRTRETRLVAYADSALVELILRNLISNAIRYTETGGILIGCRKRNDRKIIIEVWDTGIGIPENEQRNIFREFHQLGNPERDRRKGFGLGLAIANRLAEIMHIKLSVQSVLKKGSVFKLVLPESDISIVEDTKDDITASNFIGKCILVIDDDESIRIAMHELLSSWGVDCIVADSAEKSLDSIKEKKLDLLIVDYRLREEKTGREAIALLRKHHTYDFPAIIITGDTAADRLREAQASDAVLLHKPVIASELQRVMANLL